jgi:hypothetical protein
MKKIIQISCLGILMATGFLNSDKAIAQSRIQTQTEQRFQQYAPAYIQLYTKGTEAAIDVYNDVIENAVGFSIDQNMLKYIEQNKPQTLTFTIPSPEGNLEVMLYQFDFFTADFNAWISTPNGGYTKFNYKKGTYYKGYVNGLEKSFATFSFFEKDMVGIISTAAKGNYNVISRPELEYGTNQYLTFSDVAIKNLDQYPKACATDELIIPDEVKNLSNNIVTPPTISNKGVCRTVTVSMHADYRAYQANSSDTTRTINYLTTLMNTNAALYDNDDLKIALKNTYVNTVQDNYPSNTSSAILQKFSNNINSNLTADLHQLITKTNRGDLGGVAWLDKLCSTPIQYGGNWYGPYSITDNSALVSRIANLPVYSWDVSASSHEMGHNLGSNHTHWCGWPGGAIDGCVAVEPDDRNQSCTRPGTPSNGGTIMSYCHLVFGVGVNFNNGFGPLPKALLSNKISSASCMESIEPKKITLTPSTTITANAYCDNGEWITFYNDNATADPADDIMILAIKRVDVPNFDFNQSTITLSTTANLGTGNIMNVQDNYKPYAQWSEINRYWNINLVPAPQTNVGIKVPVMSSELSELTSANGVILNETSMISFRQANPTSSAAIQVMNYNKNMNPGNWWTSISNSSTVYGDFIWAEGNIPNNTYGVRIGYGKGAANIFDMSTLGINIYPNPVTNTLNIQAPSNIKISNITVTDVLGRNIYTTSKESSNNNIEINTSHWTKGVYTVLFEINNEIYTHKIVK